MNAGKTVFAQLMDFIPLCEFRKCVERYQGNYKIKRFSCWDQYLSMAFAQLTYRESLRDIEACLRAAQPKLYHLGIRGNISRNTLANANQVRDWRIYADFAQVLIARARKFYLHDSFGVELKPGCLCPRFHDDRPVPFPLSLGGVQKKEGRRQAAYPPGSARQHPHSRRDHPREGSRCERPRPDQHGTRGYLCHGPGLS